jgi:hypothetical protein
MSLPEKPSKGDWKTKHAMARAFYDGHRAEIKAIWDAISPGSGLNKGTWAAFIEDPGLWNVFWQDIQRFSEAMLADCSFAEPLDDGSVALTQANISYFLVPMRAPLFAGVQDPLNLLTRGDPKELALRSACQNFMKTALMYMLVDIYLRKVSVRFYSHESMLFDKGQADKPVLGKRDIKR